MFLCLGRSEAFTPTEVLFFRLGVPFGSRRMERLQRTVQNTWRNQAVFSDSGLLDRRVALLEDTLGADVARLVILRSPTTLTVELEQDLAGRVDALRKLLPSVDVPSLLARSPALLQLDFEQTIEPRVRELEAMLPQGVGVERVVRRAPTLLQLTDLAQRRNDLAAMLPGIDVRQVLLRAPSLLGYSAEALARKLDDLLTLFEGANAIAMVKREPALLTYNVNSSLAAKVAVFERELPGIDVRKILAATPRLLSYDAERVLPLKLAALHKVFPGADVPRLGNGRTPLWPPHPLAALAPRCSRCSRCSLARVGPLPRTEPLSRLVPAHTSRAHAKHGKPHGLMPSPRPDTTLGCCCPCRAVRNVPQLLEFDVENTLQPKLLALRALFHSSAVAPPPPPPSSVQRLATSKLLAGRQPGRSPVNRGRGAMKDRRLATSKRASPSAQIRARSAEAQASRRGVAGGRAGRSAAAAGGGVSAREPTTVGLLRLAALDTSIVEQRLARLSRLLPEVDAIALVCKQPSLLRRDVDGALRPRLRYLSAILQDPAEASTVVVANPRLLMSSWGVLGRLPFVQSHVAGGLSTISVSTALMTPKAAFEQRFPLYKRWLLVQLEAARTDADCAPPAPFSASAPLAKLEQTFGDVLEAKVMRATARDGGSEAELSLSSFFACLDGVGDGEQAHAEQLTDRWIDSSTLGFTPE